ncbi:MULTISPECIES: LysE family translocator [unclassified Pseudomonas]|uniref:LysE family translocator n=1 Tax=unclassified Pseudomonas TaxID=196821 RepID=UPI001E4A1AB0|nr:MULTISPECIES: LysE family translocator [unclassified Pseudomonas]MCE0914390.1 LysE family translocator [Pseudomonas sp. NMI760_13]MCF1487038.1 LysE family translocator [Pseudomonas sp. AA27]MCP8632877.1 LysE family translocator [Pseudomonas sp. DVZ6]MDD7783412.1 LysE family translocator [Pseudomonas sp. DVZ24]
MSLHEWFGFVVVAMLVTLTPGPGVIMALSNSVAYGPRRAMLGSIGNAFGLLAISAATSAGLGVVLQASATALLLLKVLGASYLIYLGVKQWRSRTSAFDKLDQPAGRASTNNRLMLNGVTVALTNPKAILFFAAFLPQFIRPGSDSTVQLGILVLTFAACSIVSHAFYVTLAQVLRRKLASPNRARLMNRLFGASFVALGASLFTVQAKVA